MLNNNLSVHTELKMILFSLWHHSKLRHSHKFFHANTSPQVDIIPL